MKALLLGKLITKTFDLIGRPVVVKELFYWRFMAAA